MLVEASLDTLILLNKKEQTSKLIKNNLIISLNSKPKSSRLL
jgi:hypothetical protein